ncbi:hypothetical protein STA3757_46910 [Stanieria sp. NIES-3757]|nr:hypothetical protein STA3757_46910 [Stanieria sp. NIES-3757]
MFLNLKFLRQSLTHYLTALVCFAGIIFFQKQYFFQKIISQKNIDYFQQEQSLKTDLNLQKKLPNFGLKNLIADWNLLQYIQYFGDDKAREATGYSLVTDYFEIIVEKDPRFIQALLSLSTANSIFVGRPDQTIALMNQALNSLTPEKFPMGYYVWTYKGVDEILFLGDLKAAENSYQKAAEWADLQTEPTWKDMAIQANNTAQFLATNPDSTKVQVYAWLNILSTARDEKTKQHALQQVKALGADIIVTETGELQVKLPTT